MIHNAAEKDPRFCFFSLATRPSLCIFYILSSCLVMGMPFLFSPTLFEIYCFSTVPWLKYLLRAMVDSETS